MKDEAVTVDELMSYDLKVIQPIDGYRFSLDPLLLCEFVKLDGIVSVIDLGTGSGVIPLVLARRKTDLSIVGIELQREMAELAERNVALNQLSQRIEVINGDISSLRQRFPVSSFDLVICNPPYRKRGTGRVSPNGGRDLARHESTASLADFLDIAKYLVAPSGKICFSHHPSRLPELIEKAVGMNLAPLRLQMVHGTPKLDARIFLVELAKARKADLKVLPPLVVHDR